MERRLDPLLERDSTGGRRLVAPRPASRLLSSDGDRAQMNAWNEETVNTPSLFNVFFVGRDTWVSSDWEEGVKREGLANGFQEQDLMVIRVWTRRLYYLVDVMS